jgi:signal transduction histidine kinase
MAWGINLIHNMSFFKRYIHSKNIFDRARIILTLYYVAIQVVILASFSGALVLSVESKLQENLHDRIVINELEEDPIHNASTDIIVFIYSIDATLLVMIALLSYFLAGRTLKPIKEALDAQKKFSADASHDLRTPIATIITESEVALQTNQINQKEYQKIIESNLEEAKKMNILVTDLLLIARGENKKRVKDIIQLSELLNSICGSIRLQAKAKKIIFKQSIESGITIQGHKTDIERAINNILQNAINYTNAGKIEVELKKQGKMTTITVTDTGVGISEKDIPFVFDRFYKASHSRNDESGSGLGLPIAKEIIENSGGTISISSRVGIGTKVAIVF